MKKFKTPADLYDYAHSFDDQDEDCSIMVCGLWGDHFIQSVPRTCCVCQRLVALDAKNVSNSEAMGAMIACIDCMCESGLLSDGKANTHSMIGGNIMSIEEGKALVREMLRVEKAQEN